jgi:hypothetical protein
MQMKRTLGILLAVCFLMSVTAAAVSAGPHNSGWFVKTKAVNDTFTLDSRHNSGNVLKNDIGKNLKVVSAWGAKKGKVSMKSNGKFTYTPFKSRQKIITDSFKYAIIGKDKKVSSTKVTIIFRNKMSRGDYGGR